MVKSDTRVTVHVGTGDEKRYGGVRVPSLYWTGIELLAEKNDVRVSTLVCSLIDAGLRAQGVYPIRLHGSPEQRQDVRALLAAHGELITVKADDLYEDVLLKLEGL